MKHIFTIILTVAILITTTINSFAAENTHSTTEVENYQALLNQLKSEGAEPVGTAYLTSPKGEFVYSVDIYVAPNSQNDNSITYIASTENATLKSTQTRASYTDEQWDSTTSVYFSMTVDYSKNSSNYICLRQVSGSYNIQQSGISVTNQSVEYVQESPLLGVNDYGIQYPTSSSFSYNTGFTNYIPDNISTMTFGATWKATINRGNSSWSFSFPSYRYLMG